MDNMTCFPVQNQNNQPMNRKSFSDPMSLYEL